MARQPGQPVTFQQQGSSGTNRREKEAARGEVEGRTIPFYGSNSHYRATLRDLGVLCFSLFFHQLIASVSVVQFDQEILSGFRDRMDLWYMVCRLSRCFEDMIFLLGCVLVFNEERERRFEFWLIRKGSYGEFIFIVDVCNLFCCGYVIGYWFKFGALIGRSFKNLVVEGSMEILLWISEKDIRLAVLNLVHV